MTNPGVKTGTAFSRLKDHPIGFWFVFWGELAERGSYYGMRTLLALFLLDVLHFDKGRSGQTVQFFMATCYILPLLGGYIADRYLGRYRTIVYFSIPYILGHFFLGTAHGSLQLYAALGLLALGTGTIKPNTTPLMGMIYEKANKLYLLDEGISYYYAAINIGGVITTWVLPKVRDSHGYTAALMCPMILMIIAFLIFASGKKYYPTEDVRKQEPKSIEQREEERATLIRISGLFALISCFWLVYDQSATTWVFFARDHMNLQLWPFSFMMTADQVQAFNPFFIVILTPFFVWMWNFLSKRNGKPVPHTKKMMTGFILTFTCMAAMAFAGVLARSGPVSVWWEVVGSFVITLSELCISVVGLEFAYDVASPRTKSTVTAAFFLTIFVGDSVGGFFAGIYDKIDPGLYFGIQAAILAIATVLFYFVAKRFQQPKAEAP